MTRHAFAPDPLADPIVLGDYVRCGSTPDVWVVVRIDAGRALLSPSSIALAGRPRRVAELDQLTIVRAATTSIDDAF